MATMEPGLSANELALFHDARTCVGQQHTGGHVVVVVQQYMRLYPAPGSPEPCLWEQLQAQRNGGRVQRKQLVLEAEAVFAAPADLQVAEAPRHGPEDILEQSRRAV